MYVVQNCVGTNHYCCRLIDICVHVCLLPVPSSFDEEPVADQGWGGGVLEEAAAAGQASSAGAERRLSRRGTVLLHVVITRIRNNHLFDQVQEINRISPSV